MRATYDRAKGSTGCGGRAVIVEGDADKDALQEVCRYGSQRRVCRRHALLIKIVYFCRKLPQSKSYVLQAPEMLVSYYASSKSPCST